MRSENTGPAWLEETINAEQGFKTVLEVSSVRRIDSAQALLVAQSRAFGRLMMLDGAIQVTEADEFIYHEMMAHMPLLEHGAAARVLIIGGGDGGIAREVLRHPTVRAVTLVEIDAAVITLVQREFPEIAGGAFEDPRLQVEIADGARFVSEVGERYDVIIVDSPDPVGSGAVLFGEAFYAACAQRLAGGGLMATQSGMPFLTPRWFADHAATLRRHFTDVGFYLSTVPSYAGGPMAHGLMGAAPRAPTSLEDLRARATEAGLATRYWTPALHRGAFALPAYIEALTRAP